MEVVSFKKWLIKEMAHHSLQMGINVQSPSGEGELHIDSIDFRFEDYPKTTQEEITKTSRLLRGLPFFGKLPNSKRYVIFDGGSLKVTLGLPTITSWYTELPDDWWKYAACYDGNDVIKKPLRARVYD